MKKFFNYAMYVSLLAVALSFTSCQEEFEEVGSNEDNLAISSSSSTAKLIENISTKDGSFDNIVDGASCFDINFPYSVEVNGLELTIDSKEDLQIIEDIFDEIDDDMDYLEILFPITITAGDFTEITVNSFEDLRELAAECKEGGDDDDIECIDFVYPMTMFTFDTAFEQTGSVVVESDKDLRLFFKGLGENDLVSFDFPISLKLSDETIVVVNSNEELARTIENAKDDCDEDDDDDYNDDDFDQSDFIEELTDCVWVVKEFRRNDMDRIAQYVDYVFDFKEDGTVTSGVLGGANIEGSWSSIIDEDGARLVLDFEMSADFTLEWKVYDVGEDRIKLYNGESNRIIMKQNCEEDYSVADPELLRGLLKECSWVITDIALQNEDFDRLLGYEFNFMAEGLVTLSNGEVATEGTWDIKFNMANKLVMAIEMADEPGVSFEWPISEMYDKELEFEAEEIGNELELQRVCDTSNEDADVVEIRNSMLEGEWIVASYIDDGEDETTNYFGYSIEFAVDNQLNLKEGGDPFATGLWRVLRNRDQKLKVFLNLGDGMPFDELTDDWEFVSIIDGRIELKDESDDGSMDTLVLERQ